MLGLAPSISSMRFSGRRFTPPENDGSAYPIPLPFSATPISSSTAGSSIVAGMA
jgi:hypothetical protein